MSIHPSVETDLRKTQEIFCSRVIEGRDFNALEQVYTLDACILPPAMQMLNGRADVIAFWKTTIETLCVNSASLRTVRFDEVGDSVIEIGMAELKVRNGELITVQYVVQWKQENGSWKWHVDIWNANS